MPDWNSGSKIYRPFSPAALKTFLVIFLPTDMRNAETWGILYKAWPFSRLPFPFFVFRVFLRLTSYKSYSTDYCSSSRTKVSRLRQYYADIKFFLVHRLRSEIHTELVTCLLCISSLIGGILVFSKKNYG